MGFGRESHAVLMVITAHSSVIGFNLCHVEVDYQFLVWVFWGCFCFLTAGLTFTALGPRTSNGRSKNVGSWSVCVCVVVVVAFFLSSVFDVCCCCRLGSFDDPTFLRALPVSMWAGFV